MNVTRIFSIIICCLVIYNGIMVKIVDSHRRWRLQKKEEIPNSAPIDINTKLQIFSALFFGILLIYLLLVNTKLLTLLFFIPGLIIYTFVFISAINTVGALALSKGKSPLTEDENGSLILVGILFSLIGLIRSNNSATELYEEMSIIQCLLSAAEYSIYVFLIGTLTIRPLKDCASIVINLADKVKSKYTTIFNFIVNKARPRKRKYVLSVWLLSKRKSRGKLLQRVIVISLALTLPVDVVGYLIQYTTILFVWLPMMLIAELVRMLGQYMLRIMSWIENLSARQVVVISSKLSIIAAMLIVVISNRYDIINTTEATTSILEFIASVVIIPVFLSGFMH